MPFPSEHAARIHDPSAYTSFARKTLTPGIDAIFGIKKDGKSEIQAYRFDRKRFTPAMAKKWLKDHDIKPMTFEDASNKKANTAIRKMAGRE
jgi:hypothetical protein